MARNNEPAFRRKTPLLICSIRTEIPYPCVGSSANVFRMSISSVPWTRSLGLSAIDAFLLRAKRKNTPLILIVTRKAKTRLGIAKRGRFSGLRESVKGPKTRDYMALLELVPEELVVHLMVILHLGCLYHGAEGARATIRCGALELCVAAFHVGAKKRRGPVRF